MTQTQPVQIDPEAALNGIGRLISVMHGAGPSAIGLTEPPPDPFTNPTTVAPPASSDQTQGAQQVGNTTNGLNYPVSQEFGVGGHPGIDIATPVGTSIVAPVAGTVTHAANDDPGGYGRWVEVTTPQGVVIRYGHLSGMNVTVGQQVTAGQLLGQTGGAPGADGSGNATGPHLHFEVHQQQGGPAVDPSSYLASGWQILGTGAVQPATTPVGDTPTPTAAPASPQAAIATGVNKVTSTLAASGPDQAQTTTQTQQAGQQSTQVQAGDTGSFATAVLQGVGAPVTSENLRALEAWMQAEGGASHNNPLNTTQGYQGASDFNAVGVKTYQSMNDAVAATVATLKNGDYGPILDALKAGDNAMAVAQAIASSPWGTGDLVERVLGGGK